MGKGEIRKLNSESRESFVEAPGPRRRERPICHYGFRLITSAWRFLATNGSRLGS